MKQDDNGLRIEARSRLLRFVDDIEMQVRGNSVAVRSASRVGYSDLKESPTLSAIRRAMITQGLVIRQLMTSIVGAMYLQSLRAG